MSDSRPRTPGARPGADDLQQTLRQLGARAHQLRATARAADHYNARDNAEDRNTGSWLMSTALALAGELAADIDGLARVLKERGSEAAALQPVVASLRMRAHQLHAATRAADHFLDQASPEDRDTGGWLVATALGLAQRLAAEFDDAALPPQQRAFVEAQVIEPHDPALMRRVTAATASVRGVA